MLALPHGAAAMAGIAFSPPTPPAGVAGQIRGEMLGDGDRTHAGAAATMRNRKCLVQIDVTDIGANGSGTGQSDLRIHVGAVHVHLSAVFVHDRTDLANFFFEHAMR